MQAVVQEVGSAVRQQSIPLHLSEANAAAQLAALDGLPGQGVDWPEGPHLAQPRCSRRLAAADTAVCHDKA